MGNERKDKNSNDPQGHSVVMTEQFILDLAERVARLEENVNWIKKLTTGTFLTTIAIIVSLIAVIARLFTH